MASRPDARRDATGGAHGTRTAPPRRVVRGLSAAAWGSAALLALAPPAKAGGYRVDPARTELVARLFKAGVAAVLAHDHVVRATSYTASLMVDRELIALSADLVVDARSLEVDAPELRVKYGLEGEVSPEQRAQIRDTMLGPEQLDAARHPEIRFRSSEVDRAGEDGLRVGGELTLHGVTRRVTFPVTVSDSAGELRARGSFRVKQSDFGIEPYSAFLGAVRNQDEVELVFDLVAVPEDRATARRLP